MPSLLLGGPPFGGLNVPVNSAMLIQQSCPNLRYLGTRFVELKLMDLRVEGA